MDRCEDVRVRYVAEGLTVHTLKITLEVTTADGAVMTFSLDHGKVWGMMLQLQRDMMEAVSLSSALKHYARLSAEEDGKVLQ